MKHRKPILFMALILAISCQGQHKNQNDIPDNGSSLPPVENRQPNTDYTPAFEGQTRIGGVKTTTPYEFSVIADNLSKPWGITTLPDGRFLITEKEGTMRIATTDGSVSPQITGIPEVDARGQGGLLGLTIAPDFAQSRMVYFLFSERTTEGTLTAVAKGRLTDNERTLENVQIIYRAVPYFNSTLHYGGRIVFDGNGNLFVCTGERSDLAARPKAQFLDNALGKVIRITTEGQPVPDNPFIHTSDALPEIYTYGHRNPQGIAIHPVSGDLWLSEMGPRGGDELNLIKPGLNYGWPTITYGIEYGGETIGDGITQKEGMEQPVYYWDPVLSPSGMTFYSSNAVPEWQNNLFLGGLNSNHIARLVIENDKVVGEERLLSEEGQRFRDLTEDKEGALYAITDEGRLYRIARK